MTALAIGAATRPPAASLPALPPSSTTTATATLGSLDGAKPVNQACGALPLGVLRGAGLAGHVDAADLGGPAGAALDDGLHHPGQRRRGVGRDGLRQLFGLRLVDDLEVGGGHLLDEVRAHHDAVVGDGGGDHRDLQGRDAHVVLADRGLGELGLVELGRAPSSA